MSKNILVLTGSPRKGGNSDLLADAFVAGAKRAGNTVTKYTTADKNIKGCTACNACFSKGTACVFHDDFNELATLVEKAEMIVFATPLYWFSFPAQLKAAIDKFYSFFVAKRELKIAQCVLLVCGEDDKESSFAGLVKSYELVANYLNWKDAGQIIVTSVNEKSDIIKTDALQRAEKLGEGIS
ncbi:MAG: flavodoxin family protein [Planctomycetaceae bacterium]|jgi:multimeric flavodoxin WrbA|nr:flavodoxin family protein [Planctomycetaceae bacterium]